MAAPLNIRQINRRAILDVLLRTHTSTRSDLARATGLSQPTAGKIVDDLLAEGVLEPAATLPSAVARMGRPGHDLTLNRAKPHFLAIQLGVVHTRLAALPVAPPEKDEWDQELKTADTMHGWLKSTAAAARKLLTPSMKSLLLSIPGLLDETTGRSILSPNLRWLEGQIVTAGLQERLGLPVFAVQELRCLALGHYAIDRDADSFLLVDFGNGVGSAPIVHGHLLHHELPFSGELGHTPVLGNTRKCGCGGVGCLETLIRREQLLGTLGIDGNDWHEKWTRFLLKLKPGELPPRFKDALQAAALGIAGALNVLGINRVVITGYLSELPDQAMRSFSDAIEKAAVAGRFGTVQTLAAPRRRLAGLARVGIDRVIAPV